MKLFVYKTLFVCFCVFLLFQFTIGSLKRNLEQKIYNLKSKENVEMIKEKIREEIKNSLKKDNILNEEDATLIKNFLNKINNELSNDK